MIDTYPHVQICCLLESWNIHHEQRYLIGEGNHCQYSMAPCWTDITPLYYYSCLSFTHFTMYVIVTEIFFSQSVLHVLSHVTSHHQSASIYTVMVHIIVITDDYNCTLSKHLINQHVKNRFVLADISVRVLWPSSGFFTC